MWDPQPLSAHRVRALPREVATRLFGGEAGRAHTFARYGVHGKGTCFFHSVCAATDYDGYLGRSKEEQLAIGRKFRCDFTAHLTQRRWDACVKRHGLEAGDAGEMRRRFCENGTWADETMIRYVSERLNINIVFVDVAGKSRMYCGVHGKPGQPTLAVLWVDRAHFEPLAVIRPGAEKGKTRLQFLLDARKDADLVGALMRTYSSQCALT